MDKKLLIEASHLASELCLLAHETGNVRIARLADKACDRERRRFEQYTKEQNALRPAPLPSNRKGRPDTKDRPRAGVWRRK